MRGGGSCRLSRGRGTACPTFDVRVGNSESTVGRSPDTALLVASDM